MKPLLRTVVFTTAFFLCGKTFSQNNVGIGTPVPNKNAVLHLDAHDKGFLVPRMSDLERFNIHLSTEDDGMLVYDTYFRKFFVWNGALLQWMMIKSGNETTTTTITTISRNGTDSRTGNAPSGMQVISHGLGATPKKIRINAVFDESVGEVISSTGSYDGTTQGCVAYRFGAGISSTETGTGKIISVTTSSGANQTAVISVDGGNIYLNWIKTGTPSANTIRILWEADGY